jgi:predicted patatin/cPLA2 family phospholipase
VQEAATRSGLCQSLMKTKMPSQQQKKPQLPSKVNSQLVRTHKELLMKSLKARVASYNKLFALIYNLKLETGFLIQPFSSDFS